MSHTPPPSSPRITLRTIRRWMRQDQPFAMLTCYDATTARWLWRAGVQVMLVGDTAAQMIYGHDSTLPATMQMLLPLTAAVRRGAPHAYIMGDMPFGSYQCGHDLAMENAVQFLTAGQADAVKLEVDQTFLPLVQRMASSGIPVVAHIGSRPQHVLAQGGFQSTGKTPAVAKTIISCAQEMVNAGVTMLLVEAVPEEVTAQIMDIANQGGPNGIVPVIGCGAGPTCHGHVAVLHDILGMTDWQPPFAPPLVQAGQLLQQAAEQWVKQIQEKNYLKTNHPYKMNPLP